MESALPLLLFLAFLFGSALLILVCGIQYREDERSPVLVARPEALRVRHFLEQLEPAVVASPSSVVDDVLIDRFEQFLRSERQAATRFVSEPSLANLYVPAGTWASRRTPLVEQVERYLRKELSQVAQFVSEPSVQKLYGQFVPQMAHV